MKITTEDKYFIFDRPQKYGWLYIRNRIRYFFLQYFYKLLLLFANVKSLQETKYNVAICAIFKNEAPYLKEWIEFHKIVGVDHFYMYNNNSDDDYLSVLQPYIDEGTVTLIQWPYNQQQMECYQACIESFAKETKWLGFIDIDEFIVPKSCHNVYEFLKKFENWPSVVLYWKNFGTSGKISRDVNGLVTEDFVVCFPKHKDIGKCFYNTAFGFDKNYKHNTYLHHSLWGNFKGINIPPVNAFGKLVRYRVNWATGVFPIQINHYMLKSYLEYCGRKNKGDVFRQKNIHDDAYFFDNDMMCTAVDYSVYKYLMKLKFAMRRE